MSEVIHSFTLHSPDDPKAAPVVMERIEKAGVGQAKIKHVCHNINPLRIIQVLASWHADRMALKLGTPIGAPIPEEKKVATFSFRIVSASSGAFIEISSTNDQHLKRVETVEVTDLPNVFLQVSKLALEEHKRFQTFNGEPGRPDPSRN